MFSRESVCPGRETCVDLFYFLPYSFAQSTGLHAHYLSTFHKEHLLYSDPELFPKIVLAVLSLLSIYQTIILCGSSVIL